MPNYRVLIADDEQRIRSAIVRWLEHHGYIVFTATDGVEAVDLVRAQSVDAIVMDLDMPRMDGLEATQIITAEYPSIPILIFTGFPREQYALDEMPVARVLSKPMHLKDLEAELRSVIEAQEATS